MLADLEPPRILPVAEHAILVEFAEVISDAAHAAVIRLDDALAAAPFPGFREAVPAYTSILIEFDPLSCDHVAASAVRHLLLQPAPRNRQPETHEVLVCYDAEFGPDLTGIAKQTGLSVEAVIAAHLDGDFRVFMFGFAPGYAYLAGVPEVIRLPRKPAPIRDVAAGSVLIAGPQCLVTTLVMPTGWWIIGRSPTTILQGPGSRKPIAFEIGDPIRFRRIDRETHDQLAGAG